MAPYFSEKGPYSNTDFGIFVAMRLGCGVTTAKLPRTTRTKRSERL